MAGLNLCQACVTTTAWKILTHWAALFSRDCCTVVPTAVLKLLSEMPPIITEQNDCCSVIMHRPLVQPPLHSACFLHLSPLVWVRILPVSQSSAGPPGCFHIHRCVGAGFNSTERAIFHVGDEILISLMAAAVLFPTSVEGGILSHFLLRVFFSFLFYVFFSQLQLKVFWLY